MRTVTRTRLAAALATPLLVSGLASCGEDAPTRTAEDVAPAAARQPEASDRPAEGSDPAAADSTTKAGPGGPTDGGGRVTDPAARLLAMSKAMARAGSARVAMDMGIMTARGEVGYDGGQPTMRLVMHMSSSGAGDMEVRYAGGAMYMSVPGVTPRGKFIRIDESSPTMGPMLDQIESMGPEASVGMLQESVRSMRDLGTEDVEGEETTHYRLSVDTAKAMDLLGELDTSGQAGMPPRLDYDLWVTDDDLVRRIGVNVGSMAMRIDYTDWGKPVSVPVPAPGDLVKAPAGF